MLKKLWRFRIRTALGLILIGYLSYVVTNTVTEVQSVCIFVAAMIPTWCVLTIGAVDLANHLIEELENLDEDYVRGINPNYCITLDQGNVHRTINLDPSTTIRRRFVRMRGDQIYIAYI